MQYNFEPTFKYLDGKKLTANNHKQSQRISSSIEDFNAMIEKKNYDFTTLKNTY